MFNAIELRLFYATELRVFDARCAIVYAPWARLRKGKDIGYSSKNVTSVKNENQNDMQSNNQYKEINQLQENTNNESEINTYQNTDTTTQFNMDNEYKSTNEPENPYISKDMYADYSENSKQTKCLIII